MDHPQMKWTGLAAMALSMFVVMYVLMYLMVDTMGNVFANINQFYMTAAMTGAMMLLEIAFMRSMYTGRVKALTVGIGCVVMVISIVAIRGQLAVSDKQFLKSMIPHHGAALLMCQQTKLEDPEIRELCDGIIVGQQSEIDWMQLKLSTFKR